MSAVVIEEFRPMQRNSRLGFCRVRMPSGIIYHDVSAHNSNGTYWASPASKPQVNRDGVCLKGRDGKVPYVPVVSFASKELRDKFASAVIGALRGSHPEAFGG